MSPPATAWRYSRQGLGSEAIVPLLSGEEAKSPLRSESSLISVGGFWGPALPGKRLRLGLDLIILVYFAPFQVRRQAADSFFRGLPLLYCPACPRGQSGCTVNLLF